MAGFLSFLGFGRKSKPNLAQAYQNPPSAESSPLFGDLRQLASQRIKAGITGAETPGVGYGPGFLDRATSAPIANIDANFQNRTLPLLSSEQSKRGIARSSIATDQIGQADLQRNRDVNDLISKFYVLNEQAKKSDITQGIQVGDQLDTQFLNQGNEQASQFNAAERGNTERTAAVAATNNAADRARQNQALQAGGALAGDFFGSQAGQGMLKSLGLEGMGQQNSSQVKLPGASDDSNSDIQQLIKTGMSIAQIAMLFLRR